MRYRWDPAYPMGRRYGTSSYDASMRASDAERNEVADKLSHHFAAGRLDQTEFKTRLDTAMSATTRGDLDGLFSDLPPVAVEPAAPMPRRRGRFLPLWALLAVLIVGASVTASTWPFVHVPWFLVFVVALFVWHRAGRWHHHH
jgi:hypothetical protein